MCLYEEAHGVDASHPIFQGPFPVVPTLQPMQTPEHYKKVSPELGDTMPAWRVHRDKIGQYVGVVADGFGFTDSPDAEWIASGRNSKNARAAALARQGNFFHWGFAASPPEMTDEAQRVFLNTLVYMRKFAGQKPLVVGEQRSREWLPVYVAYSDELPPYVKDQLPTAWLEAAGKDMAMLRRLATEQLGFVRRDGKRWQVDADCAQLGIDNRLVGSLRSCVDWLADDQKAKAARAVLERYTGEKFATAAEWRRWLDDAGERLFHSDGIGRFAAAPRDCPPPHRRKS